MPNWYSGTAKITGDIQIFKDWVQEKYSKNENLDNFAQTFAPLSSGEWNYATACKEWGSKWDFEIDLISDDDNEFVFSFLTPWNSPCFLWKQLETKYNVQVDEFGYEEAEISFYKYKNGREIFINVEPEWFKDKYDFEPSKEALEDEEIYEEELYQHKTEHWNDELIQWNENVSDDDVSWCSVILQI